MKIRFAERHEAEHLGIGFHHTYSRGMYYRDRDYYWLFYTPWHGIMIHFNRD